MPDPTAEIYAALDKAGLTAGNLLNSRMSMERIVNQIRTKLVANVKEIIEERDKQ